MPEAALRIKTLTYAVLVLMLGSAIPATATAPKSVLLLYDEDRDFPGLAAMHNTLRTTFKVELKDGVDLYTESMNVSQFKDEDYDRVLREHYLRKYRDKKLDLIVAVMGPSLHFLLRNGGAIFPGTPIVFCGVDASDLEGVTLRPNITGVLIKRVFSPTLDLVLRLQPKTHNVVVVGGASPFDRQMQAMVRRDLKPYEGRVAITYLTGLPMADTLAALSSLPPQSAVLHVALLRDGAGRTFVPHDAVSLIAASANAPVYVFVDQYVGWGAVGGDVYSIDKHARSAAEVGLRILRGEPPASIPPVELTSTATMFDARQLERWKIDERALPRGSIILFDAPSAWALYRWYVLAATALIVLQGAFIAGLLVSRRQRRRAQAELAERLRFEMLVSDVAATCAGATVDQFDERIRDGLRRIVMFLGVDRGALWRRARDGSALSVTHVWQRPGVAAPPATLDLASFPYLRKRMRAGEIVCFTTPDELPPPASVERVAFETGGIRSLVAVPLLDGEDPLGALAFISLDTERPWPPHIVLGLRTLGEPFATALIRMQSAAAVESSTAIAGAVLAALPGETAIVDSAGTIVQTNEAWATAARSGAAAHMALKVGANYLEACRNAVDMPRDVADKVHASIESILRGERDDFALEYPTSRRGEDRWFEVRVRRLVRFGGGAAVMHFDVTARRQAEAAAQRHLGQIAHLDRVAGMGQLASAIAHELNQPLTGILANAQAAGRLLAGRPPDLDELRACLADIVTDDKRASEVIRRMRQMLRKTDSVTTPLALNELAANTIRLVANDALLHAVSIEFKPAPALAAAYGDVVQIQQVILNLLTNAIAAAASGPSPTRTVTVWTAMAAPPYVELGVHDSGEGIAAGDLARIFEPFFTTRADGLGMGLAISRTIVEAHGGRLLAENDPAGGATFRVHLRTDQPGLS